MAPATRDALPRSLALAMPGGCGVEYTAVESIYDEQLAEYGVPELVDSSQVCLTWTGTDYVARVVQLGSSEPDSTGGIDYTNGVITELDANGSPLPDGTESIGPDAFAAVQATEPERQAAAADPYYAIYQDENPPGDGGGGGGGGGGDECGLEQRCEPTLMTQQASQGSALPDTVGGLQRHGVRRRGVRALLGDRTEIVRAATGNRRFRSVQGDEETILEMHPGSELLVGQETKSPRGQTKARLYWKLHDGRMVRHRMDIEGEELVNGKVYRSRATIQLSNVKWSATR